MAWIESHQALGQHPKTLALAAELGCSLPTAVGHLQYLWWWALDYAQDGIVRAQAQPVVVRACQWHGRDGHRFWSALVSAGFVDIVDETDGTARIHDWREYAGRLIDRRRKDAERKRTVRQMSTDHDPGSPADVQRMSGARPDVPTQPTGPTGPDQPDRTVPNQPEETAGRHRARTHARGSTSPKLLAEHLMRVAQEQASRAEPGQPVSTFSRDDDVDGR